MLMISEEEVLKHYSMKQCIEDVEKAFELSGRAEIVTPFRTILHHDDKGAHTLYMPSFIPEINYSTVKIASIFPGNKAYNVPTIQSTIVLSESKTGQHVANIAASTLTMLRTGAISGVATRYMAREDAKSLSVIGCGVQSFGQILAIMEVRELDKIYLYNRTKDKAFDLKEKVMKQHPNWSGDIIIVDDVNDAVSKADILVSSTSANKPVFSGEYVKPGTHINAIGSCEPTKQEYDVATLQKASKVVVDTLEGVTAEAGGLIIPDKNGEWSMENIYSELADIVVGKKVARENDEEITLLDSVGVGFLDTVCAASIYQLRRGEIASRF
ncbi:ornithine cyclodeaminase family protein [Sporosarcina sp. FSL K6-1522]|uniref:ornithine cyclodeaminase family protein n=1 Tax=Sporosarcina sp. FSL K6-1522 TaxID=2921554 RepID=UPI00315B0B3C